MIDLGEIGAVPALPPDRPRRRARSRVWTWWAAAAVLAVSFAVPAAGAPSVHLAQVWDVVAATSRITVDGQNLYTVTRPGRDTALTAYRLSDGTRRWRRAVGGVNTDTEVDAVRVHAIGGQPFVTTGVCADLSDAHTMLLDPGTGAERWERPGTLFGVAVGGATLLARVPRGRCTGADQPSGALPITVDALGPDGTGVWSSPLPESAMLDTENGPDGRVRHLLAATADGRVQVRDATTGRLVVDGNLGALGQPGPARAGADGPDPLAALLSLGLVGNTLLVSTVDNGLTEVAAYELGSLAQRWLIHIGRNAGFDPTVDGLDCGPLLCLGYPTGVVAVDPATGGTGWMLDLTVAAVSGRRLIGSDGGRTVRVVDGATGRTVVALPGWQLVPTLGAPDGRVVVQRVGPRATTLGVFELGTGRLHPIGTVPGSVNGCQPTADGAVCTSGDTMVRGWRLRV